MSVAMLELIPVSDKPIGKAAKITTGGGHPAITADQLRRSSRSTPKIPTINAIDWDEQPPIPAEKIDWSGQGEPLRVRFTIGTIVGAITLIVSVLGAAAYFYWGVRLHTTSSKLHVPDDGVPWGVKAAYVRKDYAQKQHTKLKDEIIQTMRREHREMKRDILQAIEFRDRRYRRRRR